MNAYVSGLGPTNRVVLNENLLEKLSEDEVQAVVSHEFGHVVLYHRFWTIVLQIIYAAILVSLFTSFYMNPNMLQAFGFHYSTGSLKSMSVFIFFQFMIPLDFFVRIPGNMALRQFEFQADRFAVKQGYGKELKNALIKMSMEDKRAVMVNRLYVFFYNTHPPLIKRVDRIDTIKTTEMGTLLSKDTKVHDFPKNSQDDKENGTPRTLTNLNALE